jgi:hypothetical protein
VKSRLEKNMRFALSLAGAGVFVCAALISGVSFAQNHTFVTASTFASLKFIIETNGPQAVVGLRFRPGEMLLKHPYAARAVENAGGNSIVVLNAKGAFFVPLPWCCSKKT